MMKIRYALLLSVSCLGLGSFANAGLTPNITPIGKNTFIFTQRGAPAGESLLRVSRPSYTHLASQSKLLSASVIARRTSSDEAIHYNINGSPRRLSPARDDNSGTAFGRIFLTWMSGSSPNMTLLIFYLLILSFPIKGRDAVACPQYSLS